ncbi:MAG: P1 family peptidase [Gammaproteobacteria bacterium]|nr:P1 family peptidase [Gammaproteobacteria bacterium]
MIQKAADKLSVTDIAGIRIGHSTNHEQATGCTVVLCENGAACGVDIRGGAPGTRETDLLAPTCFVDKVNAILLTGGSALGLAAADGVMRYCEENGYGFTMGAKKIPIVPAAVIYDFHVGEGAYAPTAHDGYEACLQASNLPPAEGNVGAGTGALVGKACGASQAMRGGTGTTAARFSGNLIVGVLVVVNTFGDVKSYESNKIIAGARSTSGGFVDAVKFLLAGNRPPKDCNVNTIIGIVATNANFSKTEAGRVAQMANTGVAQVISPAHTMYDGDTLFALATGEIEADVNFVGIAAAELIKEAIQAAIMKSTGIGEIPAYADIK